MFISTTALPGAGVRANSGRFKGRLVTISPTLVDVGSGNTTITSLIDVSSLTVGVSRGSGVLIANNC